MDEDCVHLSILPALRGHLGLRLPLAPGQKLLERSVVATTDEPLPAHALIETYSVLTGFPPPHRAPPGLVEAWLDDRLPVVLPPPGPAEVRPLPGGPPVYG